MELSVKIRLSLQRALIHNLSTHVRGICCDWDESTKWFKIRYYLDIEPNDEERELQSIVMTEFECDIQDFEKLFEECIFSKDTYENLDKLRLVIMWRNETSIFG
ncbi:hypothetical protein [Pedobacter glucosidilyticus]|jgi:hypothetical protein|uniref:hypothetical protein n=1 Tax=Pedobacter glucosidilyticus TaxID=1122941 RepID=UPI0026EE9F76|nr:hypothetical protein [Pedobacter glucosidilyticus]